VKVDRSLLELLVHFGGFWSRPLSFVASFVELSVRIFGLLFSSVPVPVVRNRSSSCRGLLCATLSRISLLLLVALARCCASGTIASGGFPDSRVGADGSRARTASNGSLRPAQFSPVLVEDHEGKEMAEPTGAVVEREGWIHACLSLELQPGEARKVSGGEKAPDLAVFRTAQGALRAVGDACPHGKGSLSDGDIEDLQDCHSGTRANGGKVPGMCVRCPRHRPKMAGGLWFSLEDGRSFVRGPTPHYDPILQTTVHLVEERDGSVWVQATPKAGSGVKPSKLAVLAMKAERNATALLGCLLCSPKLPPLDECTAWALVDRQEVSHNTFVFTLRDPLPRTLSPQEAAAREELFEGAWSVSSTQSSTLSPQP